MQHELKWGYQIPYLVTGVLNKHPRSAMALMKESKGVSYGDFYDRLLSDEEI